MNNVQVTDNTVKFLKAFENGMEENLLAATMLWHGGIQKELTGAKSGRVYLVPGTKRKYTASAPGESPARRTGRLAQAMKYKVVNDEGILGVDASYSTTGKKKVRVATYAEWLEKGNSKMAARPFIKPAYSNNAQAILRELSRPVKGF